MHFSSALTDAQMRVDRGIAGSASQVLILTIRNVLMCAGVTVLFGQAEVYDVDQVSLLAKPHQEIIRFNVSVNEVLGVDVLDSANLERIKIKQLAQMYKIYFNL